MLLYTETVKRNIAYGAQVLRTKFLKSINQKGWKFQMDEFIVECDKIMAIFHFVITLWKKVAKLQIRSK